MYFRTGMTMTRFKQLAGFALALVAALGAGIAAASTSGVVAGAR